MDILMLHKQIMRTTLQEYILFKMKTDLINTILYV